MKKILCAFMVTMLLFLPTAVFAQETESPEAHLGNFLSLDEYREEYGKNQMLEVAVPNVVGLTKGEAEKILKNAGFELYTGIPNFVGLTENEFEESLEGTGFETCNLKIETCCDGRPEFAYRDYPPEHLYQHPRSKCLGVVYYSREKYCVRCGAVWEPAIIVNQTGGCGQYHP